MNKFLLGILIYIGSLTMLTGIAIAGALVSGDPKLVLWVCGFAISNILAFAAITVMDNKDKPQGE